MNFPLPNYACIPTYILDEAMLHMKPSTLKIVLIIIRKTIGWHKQWDRISLSQFEKLTGLNRRAVLDGLDEAISMIVVKRVPIQDSKEFLYGLNSDWFDEVNPDGTTKIPTAKDEDYDEQGGSVNFTLPLPPPVAVEVGRGGSVKFTPTKETPLKEKNLLPLVSSPHSKKDLSEKVLPSEPLCKEEEKKDEEEEDLGKVTKEEEEMLMQKLRERPKTAPKISSWKAWKATVIKNSREEKKVEREAQESFNEHQAQALVWDGRRINGDLVSVCRDRVEFTSGSFFKAVPFAARRESWKEQTARWFEERL